MYFPVAQGVAGPNPRRILNRHPSSPDDGGQCPGDDGRSDGGLGAVPTLYEIGFLRRGVYISSPANCYQRRGRRLCRGHF